MFSFFAKKNKGDKEKIRKLEDRLRVSNQRILEPVKRLSVLGHSSVSNTISAEAVDNKKPVRTPVVLMLEAEAKARRAEDKEKNIQAVMQKTGWTHAYTVEQIQDARKRTGISYQNYNLYDFYAIPVEEQKVKYDEITIERKRGKKEEQEKKNEAYITHVMNATGWTKEYATEMMLQANEENGVSFEHYSIYKFWELTLQEQKAYFSKADAERLRNIYNTNPLILKVCINKDLFCKCFDKYLGRRWLSTSGMQFDAFKSKFGTESKLIYKPLSSTGGHGIQAFEYDEKSLENTYNTLCSLPDGIIESYVIQHPEMKRLFSNSVNTIRVVTIQTYDDIPGVEKGKVHFLYFALRMGSGQSIVDNLHSGGMVAHVDSNTGIVDTDAIDYRNNVYIEHPDTHVTIKGFKVPYFDEIKKLITTAGEGIPGYLGWDIAITESGPVIIELNTHPAADILQAPFVPMKKGMRHVVEKFLVDVPNTSAVPQKSQRIPETPYGTKISGILKEGIEFYWKKLEIADGYEIFRGYCEKGPFERIAVIEKRSIGTFIDSNFDHSKKSVFYTVRSYVDNDDGTRSFSETVEAKEAQFQEKLIWERDATYMYSGTTRQIRAFWGWGEVEDPVWSSTDEHVAQISADGWITAVSSGECILTCSSKVIGQSASTKVVVDRQAVEPLDKITSRYCFNKDSGYWENRNASQTDDAIIMMVGDMMCGKSQMQKQYTDKQGWNFNNSFEYVREIMSDSDFAIGNLETLLAAGWPYMLDETYINNMNNCNATSRYLDAVKYGGFDAVTMANNHNCDGGRRALLETIDQVDKYQLAHTGVFRSESDRRFLIVNVNGIKVGYLAYISQDTGFNGKDADWSQEDKDILLNIFTPEKAICDIAACKAAGAEYVIAYMHWGFKNFRNLAKHQITEAQAVAEAGADYIVGANPHLIQMYETIKTSDGREVPCAYSIGNFQAVMKQVTGNRDSVILRIQLCRDETGKVFLAKNNYIPCYTYTNCGDKPWAPVAVSENLNLSVFKRSRKKIHKRIMETIGNKIEEFTE